MKRPKQLLLLDDSTIHRFVQMLRYVLEGGEVWWGRRGGGGVGRLSNSSMFEKLAVSFRVDVVYQSFPAPYKAEK